MKQYFAICILIWILTSCSFAVEEKSDIPEKSNNIPVIEEGADQKILDEPEIDEKQTDEDAEIPEYLQVTQDGSNLSFENILTDNDFYTRYQISYMSEGYKISGIMNIPKNIENAPLLILNHGYIDTSVYTLGRGLKREQDYFARNWFAVLHTDYRNHAYSDTDESLAGTGMILRSKKYGADAINAILAVQKAKNDWVTELQNVDSENVWMLWHSMWWGVTMYALVAASNLIDAAVLYAPVHSNEYYNYERWSSNRFSSDKKEILASELWNLDSPENFLPISPEWYFKNINSPMQMYFGTRDESCPIDWWYEIEQKLKLAWKYIDFIVYDGEWHEFTTQWNNFMLWSTDFFKENLK